jgi:hypothetical protein
VKTAERLKPTISAQSPSFGALQKCIGKTIGDVEFGFIELGPHCHESERIIFHFIDGTKLRIDLGTNAENIAQLYKGLKPKDFHANIRASYYPDEG